MKRVDDIELLGRISNSCHQAFEQLFNRYWRTLYIQCFKLIKDPAASEDIIQEVFFDMWSKRREVSIGNVGGYLHTAVKYKSFTYLMNNKLVELHEGIISTLKHTDEASSHDNNKGQFVKKALKKLPPKCGEVFHLSRFDGMSNCEISEKLGISKRTVETPGQNHTFKFTIFNR